MTLFRTRDSISRRAAIAGLGAGGLGIALATTVRQASAQDAADMATHPIVGTWLVAPRDPSGSHDTIIFGADGSVIQGWAASAAGPQGATLSGSGLGVWEPTGPRSIAFTAVTVNSDATGANLGTFTLDGHLEVGEDGQTWVDSGELSVITLRDTAGAVVQEIPTAGAPPVTAVRMRVKAPGFPAGAPGAATPTS
jgi:hypothetical protein